jgi:Cu+-exporting ATPase
MVKKIKIDIGGMHCASCAANIERSLKKIKEVKNAKVNLISNKAYIEAEEGVRKEDLIKAVEKPGYQVKSIEFEEGNRKEEAYSYKNYDKIEHEHHHEAKAEKPEMKSWFRKMIGAWIFTIPIIFFMFSERIFGISFFMENTMTIILLILAFPVIFIFGWRTIKSGIKGFTSFYFNMDSLIMLGTVIAYLTGILSLFILIQDYSGISGMIMSIFLTGKYIESRARGRASEEIRKLLELGAKKARVLRNGKEYEIEISEVVVGDIIIIKPGEKIPIDGLVIRGESAVDESMISGESMPVDKKKNDKVIGATINQDGVLYVKAEKIGKDTFLSHIIKLVEEAQGSKIPIQEFADKVTRVFVPIILTISVLTFIDWLIFTNISRALEVAISVLVIACPCALGLATPTALMVGSGIGAKKGILIRKGEAIQTIKEVKIIVFDKTGTLTKGKPEVREIFSKVNENYLLDITASLETLSEHPIAKAIVQKAEMKKYRNVIGFKILRGRGVEGKIGSKKIIIGNSSLMDERKISLKDFNKKIDDFENKGYTVMVVSEDNKAIGIIGVADAVKEDAILAISELKAKKFRLVMITGDNEKTAKAIAKQIGIDEVISNVLPEEKSKKVEELQKQGFVAFVGDGVNDAPALKQANVGIAMGTGTDIAIEAGDIVLSSGKLEGVVSAINLSKATFGKIKQNLFWAFAYNTIAIPLAVAGILHPIIAEIAMALSSITVVTNANLLRRKKI